MNDTRKPETEDVGRVASNAGLGDLLLKFVIWHYSWVSTSVVANALKISITVARSELKKLEKAGKVASWLQLDNRLYWVATPNAPVQPPARKKPE